MRIAIFIETLLTGGAELFALRMADFLSKDNEVVLYNFYSDKTNSYVNEKIKNSAIHYEACTIPFDYFIRKADSLLIKAGLDIGIRNFFLRKHIKKVIQKYSIEALHSNQFKVDMNVSLVNASLKLPHTVTIHGDYITFYHASKRGQNFGVLHYEKKLKEVLRRIDHVVCISDQQLDFFRTHANGVQNKLVKIYNGYALPDQITSIDRIKYNIPEDAFVYGMVARGIPEKGWENLVKAFLTLNDTDTYLVLVGSSLYLDTLKNEYPDERIIFAGHSQNPLEWIGLFDVGVLPSYYSSESLPTSLIEYLALGKPVIATDKGEIPNMIDAKATTPSGILIKLVNDVPDQNELIGAMKKLKEDKAFYKTLSAQTKKSFIQFDMENSVRQYKELYLKK